MERVVNLVGMGRGSSSLPDTGENWGINYSYVYGKMDRLFFMDGLSVMIHYGEVNRHKEVYGCTFLEAIKKWPRMRLISKNALPQFIPDEDGQIIMTDDGPRQIDPFPLSDALSLAPGAYFTSTMAYAICMAIIEKVDRIRIYGFEVWSGSDSNEYEYQRPCIDFWLAFALGRGIKVEIPYYLMKTAQNRQNVYGYMIDDRPDLGYVNLEKSGG